MKKFLTEFKNFALKGNMLDLAIGMIIGAAFTGIVNSLVNDIFMPLLGRITGRIDFSNLFISLDGNHYNSIAEAGDAAILRYGAFITQLINFAAVAFVLFIIVKQVNRFRAYEKSKEAPAAATEKTCPFCKTKIPVDATRCPHCTSELPEK